MSNPMADLANFVLKLKFEGADDETTQIRRVRLPRICNTQTGAVSYEELVGLAISFVIPEKPVHGSDFTVKLTYKDVDDDLVVIGSSEELLDAIDQYKDQRVLRITAEVKRTTTKASSGVTSTPSPQEPSEEVDSSRATSDSSETGSNDHDGGVTDAGVQTGYGTNGGRSPMLENVVESVVDIILRTAVAITNRGDQPASRPTPVFYSPDGIPSGPAEAASATPAEEEAPPVEAPPVEAAAGTEEPSVESTSEEVVAPPAASAPPAEETSTPPSDAKAILAAGEPKGPPTEEKKEPPKQEKMPAVDAPTQQEERPFIHGRHTCDSCLTTPIVGKRYHALNMSDYDLCEKCHDNYSGGEIQFEPVELERDRHLQNRWHRRRERMNNRNNNNNGRGAARGFGPRPHHTRWNPPPPPGMGPRRGMGGKPLGLGPPSRGPPPPVHPAHRGPRGAGGLKAPPPGPPPKFGLWKGRQEQKASEDDAMAMAIKLSLEDMKKKSPEKPQEAPKKDPPQPKAPVDAPEVSTDDAAKSTASVSSEPESAKSDQVEEKSVLSKESVEPLLVETVKETEVAVPKSSDHEEESTKQEEEDSKVPPVSVAAETPAVQVETVEDDDKEEEASVASDPFVVNAPFDDGSISIDVSRFKNQESPLEPPAKKEGSRESSFSSDAAGNGEIADMLGETLDKCAEAIDAMVSELDRNSFDAASSAASAVSSFVGVNEELEAEETPATEDEEEECAANEGATILESVEDTQGHPTDDLSAGEERSEGDWQVVSEDQQIGSDSELARAAQMIGSALFNSDMRSSGEMMSTLTGSAEEIDGMSHASSALTSLPSVNNQIAETQRQRWASQLAQLRTLGIDDDARCVEILERLTAANIGCGVSDDVSVQDVINELWK